MQQAKQNTAFFIKQIKQKKTTNIKHGGGGAMVKRACRNRFKSCIAPRYKKVTKLFVSAEIANEKKTQLPG